MTDRLQLSDILDRLEYRTAGRGYRARCPAHGGDNKTALAIQEGEDGKVLLHCHAHGCSYEEIVRAWGCGKKGTAHRPATASHPNASSSPTMKKLLWPAQVVKRSP